jgi:hypothetical protein
LRPWFRVPLIALLTATCLAQRPTLKQEEFEGRDAYVLANTKMRVSALRGAGHIAEIRLLSADPLKSVNPMRVPHYPTIEPWEYDPVKHDALYGGGPNRLLMAGYMGHLLNFPTFGGPSEDEARNGLGNHGEALAVEWKNDKHESSINEVQLWYSADLPKTKYKVGRVLTLPRDETVLYIEEWVENLEAFDRPAHWVEHATFGPPFVEPGKTVLDMSATKGVIRGNEETNSLAAGEVVWPEGRAKDGAAVDLRVSQPKPASGTYAGYLMDPSRERSYFTMFHPGYHVLVGYIWNTKDFPWIGDWQENGRNTQPPWNSQVIARGMEFGTTPFGGPMKTVVEEGSLYGVPVYRWIGGRKRLTARYVAFLAEIPEGFRGVENVEVREGAIEITERGTGSVISIKSARDW